MVCYFVCLFLTLHRFLFVSHASSYHHFVFLAFFYQSFKGEMPKLAVHGVASQVVEYMFQHLPPKALSDLKQEFYGPHFSLFAEELTGPTTLENNLKNAKTDTQKEAAMNFVKDLLNKGMTKGFYGHMYFQQLFAEYIDVADPNDIRAVASTASDHSPQLLSTRHGARVVAALASYGTPKDRKRICKSLKGYTASSLLHRDAYLAVLRLIQVTDDTVSIQKSLLNELLTIPKPASENDEGDDKPSSGMLSLALSDTGSKLFLLILVKDDEARMKYFDPYERSILEPIPYIKEHGKEVPTSKKAPELRRQELLKFVSTALHDMSVDNVDELIRSVPGSRVIKELYCHNPSEKLAQTISEQCSQSLQPDYDGVSIFEDPVGHRCLKNIILHDAKGDGQESTFSKTLVSSLGDSLSTLVDSNRGSFVAAALLGVPDVGPKVKAALIKHRKGIKAKAEAKEGVTAGYAALLKALS
jgi:pumilio homology domain family member 6